MWKNDKYHGPGILVGDGGSGIFRDGEKMGDVSVTELQFHDHKWSELFQWCADLLEKMVHLISVCVLFIESGFFNHVCSLGCQQSQ